MKSTKADGQTGERKRGEACREGGKKGKVDRENRRGWGLGDRLERSKEETGRGDSDKTGKMPGQERIYGKRQARKTDR